MNKTFKEFLKEAMNMGFTLVQTGYDVEPGEEGEFGNEDDRTTITYDIMKDGQKVGELEAEDFFGGVSGHLYNKKFDGIEQYGRWDEPEETLNTWLSSKTGQRWLSNIDKYKPLSGPTNDYRIKR